MTTCTIRSSKRINDPSRLARTASMNTLLVLLTLNGEIPLTAQEIKERIDARLDKASCSSKIDFSTIFYALRRLSAQKLVRCRGRKNIRVRGPYNSRIEQKRSIYVITAFGQEVLQMAYNILSRRPLETEGEFFVIPGVS